MRLLLRAIFLVLTVFAGLGHAQADAPYALFTSVCVKTCSDGGDKNYCKHYCGCVVDGIRAKGNRAVQNAIMRSDDEMHAITMICAGNLNMELLGESCKSECAKGNCAVCSCVNKAVKSIGTPGQIGEFFLNLGQKEPAATAKIQSIAKSCAQ